MTADKNRIDELLKKHNPFLGRTVVRAQQIWGKSYPDVPSINALASDAVFQAVNLIKQEQLHTIGITITGDKGLGKSQIISRIRHGLQKDGGALFVYVSNYEDLNRISSELLKGITRSLRAFGTEEGVTQWQEVATALLNENRNWNYTSQQYINQFPLWLKKYSNTLIDKLTDSVNKVKQNISNPYLVKAILWTLSEAHKIYATYWLSGEELAAAKAEELGLPNSINDNQESESLKAACEILNFVSDYKVPIICFDELDSLGNNDAGFLLAQVVAVLAKDLSNNLKKGVLLLSMYPDTWRSQVKILPQLEALLDRIANYPIPRENIKLKQLNSDDVVALVSGWLKEFYQVHKISPPTPVYPFEENQLREIGRERPLVRDVIIWCGKTWSSLEQNPPIPPENLVKSIFENELSTVGESIQNYLEDNQEIANALFLGFNCVKDKELEKVTIENIEIISGNSCQPNFKIIGKEDSEVVKIGVSIIQDSVGRSVTAKLGHLIKYKHYDITRGCLVRGKKVSPRATKANKHLKILLQEKGGEWVKLQSEDIKPLLAILAVYNNRESYDLTEAQIFEFIEQEKIAINNPLIREILSNPAGQEPDNLIYEDLPISIPKSVDNIDDKILGYLDK
ncbi:MAG: hypothetical protein QNJ68_19950 [Microcoleaceae cyanobacterium MO_207.B10]|nr:hypothetical protein [Microcoleaceae cyanobacterium MO_207.B10]